MIHQIEDEQSLTQSLGEYNKQFRARGRVWRPATDLVETDADYRVILEAAGLCLQDFSISLVRGTLFIHGVRDDVSPTGLPLLAEIPRGEFAVEIRLPGEVDQAAMVPDYRNGLLTILLPKLEAN